MHYIQPLHKHASKVICGAGSTPSYSWVDSTPPSANQGKKGGGFQWNNPIVVIVIADPQPITIINQQQQPRRSGVEGDDQGKPKREQTNKRFEVLQSETIACHAFKHSPRREVIEDGPFSTQANPERLTTWNHQQCSAMFNHLKPRGSNWIISMYLKHRVVNNWDLKIIILLKQLKFAYFTCVFCAWIPIIFTLLLRLQTWVSFASKY